jgi:transposase
MRGLDHQSGSLFSYVDLEKRIRPDHPLRTIRRLVDDALASMDRAFADLYCEFWRPSIPPERLLRAMLLQAFYSIRSERLLMERLDHDLLFRWFVGLGARPGNEIPQGVGCRCLKRSGAPPRFTVLSPERA